MGLGKLNPGCGCSCCSLYVDSNLDGGCSRIHWPSSCECINGKLHMQAYINPFGWFDMTGWSPHGQNQWFPNDFEPWMDGHTTPGSHDLGTVNSPVQFRLQCRGIDPRRYEERWTSNAVIASIPNTRCKAVDASGIIVGLGATVDYTLQSFTYDIPTDTTTLGSVIPMIGNIGCGNSITVHENTDYVTKFHFVIGQFWDASFGKYEPQYSFYASHIYKPTGVDHGGSQGDSTAVRTQTRGLTCYPRIPGWEYSAPAGARVVYACDLRGGFANRYCVAGTIIRYGVPTIVGTEI
jgi:hypothetical protein